MNDLVLEILLILVLISINGYFAAAEISLISTRRAALQTRADKGSKGARMALMLLEDPTRLLSTTQVMITFVGFLAASAATISLSRPIEAWLRSLGVGWIAPIASSIGVVVVTILVSYVTLVLGELLPKRLGLQRAEKVAIATAGSLMWLERVLSPLVWLLTVSTNGAARLFGLKSQGGQPGVSEEEIKLLVTEQGTLLDEEKRMIHEIFDIGDTVVREIMVPRVDMALVEDVDSVADATSVMQGTGFSRLPVFHEDPDKIVGIALLKDLVGPLAVGQGGEVITEHMREPVFVPETKGILPLMSEMRATHNQMVIVVDEYGGTAGLATLEDIVEEIVGDIVDESDKERRFVQKAGPHEWNVDGRLPIEEALDLEMPVEESDEYETVAGWLLAKLGHIPVPGERYEHDGWVFRVQAMRRRRVARILVTRVKAPAVPSESPREE
ncbi:MAG: hemolysin family protein [Coriobacteriia bacterium]